MIRFLKTVPVLLNLVVIVSIAFLFVKNSYLDLLPEIFIGAYKIGLIVEGLFASTIASYIFYLVVVHRKKFNDKKIINPYIKQWIERIVSDCNSQIKKIAKAGGINFTLQNMTENQLISAMKNISPLSNAPLFLFGKGTANWYEYFCFHQIRIERAVSKILAQMIYIDSELVALVAEIEETSFFAQLRQVNIFVSAQSFSVIAFDKNFYSFCQKCRALDQYMKEHF